MYSQNVIEKTLDVFQKKNGWRPEYHSLDQVADFSDKVRPLLTVTTNKQGTSFWDFADNVRLTENDKRYIRRWVKNEQYLCNPPEAPIWMADFTFKPIGDIKIGDQIIGWKQEVPNSKRNKGGRPCDRICISTVEAIMRRKAKIVKVTMASGKVIRCTPDHKWSNGNRNYRWNIPWIPAKPGRYLRKLVDVYPNNPSDIRTAGWLGGIYDGEGSRRFISQSEVHNPDVFAEISRALRSLGFDCSEFCSKKRTSGGVFFKGGWSEAARFIAWCRPIRAKWLLKEVFDGHIRSKADRIISVEDDGEGEVVSMQTSTGNYVCWGYMSKNCFSDAMYFLTRYAHFCDVEENIYRFSPRDAQKILHAILAEHDDLQIAIELFILKARQLGFTTAIALYFMHRLLFRMNVKAVMASVTSKQSDLIARIQETCSQRLPFWLAPGKTTTKSTAPEWENGSILSVQSGSQAFGIAQGWTPSCIHISELGDIPNPKKVLEEGLFRAAHSTRSLFFTLEGTGNADSEWQKEKWDYYKANPPRAFGGDGGGRFRAFFVPPACARDLYPLPDWIRKNPVPESWSIEKASTETKRMRREAELYIRSTDYLAKTMGSNFSLSREYLWFWDCNWKEAVATHNEKVWLAQMPHTDKMAFQSKHDHVFRDETIEIVKSSRERVYDAYAVTGRSIIIGSDNTPYEPDPHEIDMGKARIPLTWQAPDGNSYYFELVPLLPFDDSKDENCFNKLLVFHYPTEANYSFGVDTADGLGMPNEDRFFLSGVINRTGKERDEQVFAFISNSVNSPQAARIVACLAAWYGQSAVHPMGPKICIEQVRKPGDECQHQLKLMGFYHFHQFIFYDKKGFPDPTKATREGWFTNRWSRSMLLNKYVDAINTGWFKVNHPVSIREMEKFMRVETAGMSRMDHDQGQHNDAIFADAQAYFTAHDLENTARRFTERYQAPDLENEEVNYAWASNEIVLT